MCKYICVNKNHGYTYMCMYAMMHICMFTSSFVYSVDTLRCLAYPEGPSTQYLRLLVPNSILFMVFGL